MEITVKYAWENHVHQLEEAWYKSGCYSDYCDQVCKICNLAASQSGIPNKEHAKHPNGCKCYWCIFCRCSAVIDRDKEAVALKR